MGPRMWGCTAAPRMRTCMWEWHPGPGRVWPGKGPSSVHQRAGQQLGGTPYLSFVEGWQISLTCMVPTAPTLTLLTSFRLGEGQGSERGDCLPRTPQALAGHMWTGRGAGHSHQVSR